ncbi:MAG: AAA family ATPase, partial [Coriobacteriales bacterium]|nr:AAA family ATPase [Coriobacteriales bacterium]
EIDAVGRQRGAGLGGGHDEREQTLNQLLVEMDGFADHQSVILIAATNRPDILDPALLRPGRFDRQITVMRPDLKGRIEILRVHTKDKPLAHSVELETVARMTPGFTGADLANLMNEAALLTVRRNMKLITMAEITEAMERTIAGPERKSRIMTETEKRMLAYHEAGHALVGHNMEHSDPIHKISIISRGQALGYTLALPEEDRFLTTRKEMFDNIAVCMGGRVAEEIFCDDISTGASQDLERATNIARQMVTRYGMTEALGHQVYGQAQHEVFLGRDYSASPDYSDETARRIDEEVSKIMMSAHQVAYDVLSNRQIQMDLMVEVLLERETVDSEALDALLNDNWQEYLSQESDILARKAAALRRQEADDARRAAEAKLAKQREDQEQETDSGPTQAAQLAMLSGQQSVENSSQPEIHNTSGVASENITINNLVRTYLGEKTVSDLDKIPPPDTPVVELPPPLEMMPQPVGQPVKIDVQRMPAGDAESGIDSTASDGNGIKTESDPNEGGSDGSGKD